MNIIKCLTRTILDTSILGARGILAYLLVDRGLERYHHDLDIFINMEHLEKLKQFVAQILHSS